ncbi:hypothetical protein BGZ54_000894, partial [Gamsiella multidivaricata]
MVSCPPYRLYYPILTKTSLSSSIGVWTPPSSVYPLQVRKWRQEISAQQRALDRQKRGIETEEAKAKRMIKQMAKKNDIKTCKILAKEL